MRQLSNYLISVCNKFDNIARVLLKMRERQGSGAEVAIHSRVMATLQQHKRKHVTQTKHCRNRHNACKNRASALPENASDVLSVVPLPAKEMLIPKGVYLSILKLHSILAVEKLLAHNYRSEICYCD